MQNAGNPNKSKASPEERARLRRNQRNSRARKQEYLHDLERRWSECVRLGVQASAEIQREARRVHEENKALRCIVREMGWSDEALQQRLTAIMGSANSPAATIQNGMCLGDVASSPIPMATKSNMNPTIGPKSSTAVNGIIVPPSSATASSIQSFTQHEDCMAPDTLQTWNLYSWVNDLSEIKDAYGNQAQFDYDDAIPSSNVFFPDPSVAETAQEHLGQIDTNGSSWFPSDPGFVNGNGPSFTGMDNTTSESIQELEGLNSCVPDIIA